MGLTLESRLRRRVAAFVLPALVLVGAAGVLITSRILASSDRAIAQHRAEQLAVAMNDELAEGDDFDKAAGEVLAPLEHEGARGVVRLRGSERGSRNVTALVSTLAPGRCATSQNAAGTWTACGARAAGVETVAAIRVDDHRDAVVRLAASMALVVLLALLATAAAVRAALKPPLREVSSLTAWAGELARLSGPRHAAPSASHDEIDRLARAFDAVVDRLHDALAREQAQSGHLAHELRTPLAALRADLDLGGAGAADRMRGDVDRLDRVIEAILVLAAPAAGARTADIVNVADLARAAARRGVEIHAPDEALVAADARLVDLALANLLENAEKHGGGPRTIEVRREGDVVTLAVLDEGAGVAESELEKMFERYWRGAAGERGSGIGLAFVRAVAERYGGTARARLRPSGRGLEVAFTLGPLLAWAEA
ncbi:MAG TPA: HAMP domain-containing sensor histidine kinase [Polyangiaceae bacterium]|jgi:signal transduction histidine kinase